MTTDAGALKEVMDRYDFFRKKWILVNGSDEGFNDWFTERIKTLLPKNTVLETIPITKGY